VSDNAWAAAFAAFAERKTREADAAELSPLETVQAPGRQAGHPPDFTEIGNSWSRRFYDGGFALPAIPADRPALSLVFVQSRDGNTGGPDPSRLGGGDIDKHLIYEGLSRVAADAVLSGAATAAPSDTFLSVWRRELVELRVSLGLPRHPAQIVVSNDGHLDVAGGLLFNVPDVRVILIAGPECRTRVTPLMAERPWISLVPIENMEWLMPLARLRQQLGINRVSAIGGRRTATSLLDAGVVADICLTTTGVTGGEPDTPFYTGSRLPTLELIVRKQSRAKTHPILFEHLAVRTALPTVGNSLP
jgi:riboflavin biosynthesis pyrimidine reductase